MSLKILVVDDEEVLPKLLAMHLSLEGHEAQLASDGKQAIEMLEAGQFDIILLDLEMPIMNGIDVLRHIKAHKIPVRALMTTGIEDWHTWTECANLGAVDHLPKPFDLDTLMAAIEEAMTEPA
jgi:two-component system response regulator (stage 0 sporulation protein F)